MCCSCFSNFPCRLFALHTAILSKWNEIISHVFYYCKVWKGDWTDLNEVVLRQVIMTSAPKSTKTTAEQIFLWHSIAGHSAKTTEMQLPSRPIFVHCERKLLVWSNYRMYKGFVHDFHDKCEIKLFISSCIQYSM